MSDQANDRLLSLDVFRGITIVGMILVNCPGSDDIYPWLQHAPWHGWTPADFVFPGFLVIMGISLTISLSRRMDRGEIAARLLRQIIWRTAVIFGLGLLTNTVLIADSPLGFRVMGVLQRIALCYLICALFFLFTTAKQQACAAVAMLVGYWALMTLVPVPGAGRGVLTPEGNFASYLDRLVLGRHLYESQYDPEGFLSTIPAAATALLGVVAGHRLRTRRQSAQTATELLCAGIACTAAGLFWSLFFPLNKHLWTSSYALLTGGTSVSGFAVCYWLVEIQGIKAWARPFEIFGRNPLLAYFLSGLFYGLQEFTGMTMPDGAKGNLKLWLTARLFGGWLTPPNASLAYTLTYLLLCLGLMTALYRKKIFLKI